MINNQGNSRSRLNDAGNNLMFLLIGGTIGATVALLFAPKPGSELRQDVSDGVRHGLEAANEKLGQAKVVAADTVSHLKDTADTYYHKAQDKVTSIYNVAKKAVNDGTQEAKEIATSAAGQAEEMLNEVSNEKREPPLFEAGSDPVDQLGRRTGTL